MDILEITGTNTHNRGCTRAFLGVYRGDGINNPLLIVSYLLHVKFLFHPSSAKHEDQA